MRAGGWETAKTKEEAEQERRGGEREREKTRRVSEEKQEAAKVGWRSILMGVCLRRKREEATRDPATDEERKGNGEEVSE